MMENKNGFLSFALKIMGNEIISFRMEVDDFKTKWVVITFATVAGGVLLAPTIKGLLA